MESLAIQIQGRGWLPFVVFEGFLSGLNWRPHRQGGGGSCEVGERTIRVHKLFASTSPTTSLRTHPSAFKRAIIEKILLLQRATYTAAKTEGHRASSRHRLIILAGVSTLGSRPLQMDPHPSKRARISERTMLACIGCKQKKLKVGRRASPRPRPRLCERDT